MSLDVACMLDSVIWSHTISMPKYSKCCCHPQAIRIAYRTGGLQVDCCPAWRRYTKCSKNMEFTIIEVIRSISSPTSCSIPLLGGFLAAIPREVFLGSLSAPWVSQHYLSGPLFSPSKWHGVPVTHRPSNFTAPTKPVLQFCLLCVECVLRSGWKSWGTSKQWSLHGTKM